jgi:hypothetical protein
MSNEVYFDLGHKLSIYDDIKQLIDESGEWFNYINFKGLQVPHKIAMKDAFLQKLYERHRFSIGVLKMMPYTIYTWHVDNMRRFTINCLMDDVKSHCLFATGRVNEYVHNVIELPYSDRKFFLANTDIPHEVMNFDQTRYLFTLMFDSPYDYFYILEDFLKNPI